MNSVICKYLKPISRHPLTILLVFLLGLSILPLLQLSHKQNYGTHFTFPIFPPVFINYTKTTTIPGPRLLCMVLTTPVNYLTKTVHVQATWGRRCDTLLFLSSSERINPDTGRRIQDDLLPPDLLKNLPLLELDGLLGTWNLWGKVKVGLTIIWADYKGQFDFMIKADDDTFLIVDNLKHLLSQLSPSEPLILGHHLEDRGVEYLSGGAGYVLSHAAVKEIVEVGLSGDNPCHLPHPVGREVEVYPNEDLQMGKCAKLLNIKFQSSVVMGQSTFLLYIVQTHIIPSLRRQWWLDRTKECRERVDCVSPTLISMHYVLPELMYVYDYFAYGFTREIE